MKLNIAKYIFISLWLTFLSSCTSESPMHFDVLVTNTHVVDVKNGRIASDMYIALSQDTIREVGSMAASLIPTADQIVDANGGYALPGLWDMHVHFRGGDTLIEENRRLLPLFIGHGVTTVRDAGGDITPSVLAWAEQIEAGQLPGPDIYSSGPKLDGANPRWAGSIEIESEADVKRALDSLELLGVDYVKTYDSGLSEELYYKVVMEAESRGMEITGHMPMNADLMYAVDLGLDGIEHLYYLLPSISSKGDSIRSLGPGYGAISELLATFSTYLQDSIFDVLGRHGFYATPTLHIGEVLADLHTADHSEDSLLNFIGPGIRRTYAGRTYSARSRSPERQEQEVRMRNRFKSLVHELYRSGVRVLAGSDCGAYNSYVYPGESLHGELEALVDARLTPREALSTSIINGPEFFGLQDYYCELRDGRVGNILIIHGDPLEDITATRSIKFVVKGNKVYDSDALKSMISQTF